MRKEDVVDNDVLGPEYTDWKVGNESNYKDMDFKKKLHELNRDYDEINKEFAMMKLEFSKTQKKQKSEIDALKKDYKSCMEDLRKETHARDEAETLVKVHKETLEVKDDLNTPGIEGMEVYDAKDMFGTNVE